MKILVSVFNYVKNVLICKGDAVCRRNEQDAGVRHFRLRPLFKTRPNWRGEGAPVPNRPGPDHRGVEGAAERGGRGWSGDIILNFMIIDNSPVIASIGTDFLTPSSDRWMLAQVLL